MIKRLLQNLLYYSILIIFLSRCGANPVSTNNNNSTTSESTTNANGLDCDLISSKTYQCAIRGYGFEEDSSLQTSSQTLRDNTLLGCSVTSPGSSDFEMMNCLGQMNVNTCNLTTIYACF